MNPLKRSPLNSSLGALALTALALVFTLLFRPIHDPDTLLPFMVAVWLSAWYFGRTGGLTATGVSAVAILYFFLKPDLSLAPLWTILTRLLMFTLLGSAVTLVTASWRDGRRFLSATLSSIGDAIVVTDLEGRVTFMNPVAETLTGWPLREARGQPAAAVLKMIAEKSQEVLEDPLTRAVHDRATVSTQEATILVSRSGTHLPIEHSAAPVRDDSGRARGAVLVFRDVSNRRRLEEHATHTERMEAVGRLAGGVGGDFNNVLTVITGYAELLRAETPSTSPIRRFVDEIIYAGERAASLTRHLLAFSRGSTAQPGVIDLNSVAIGMGPMLRRLLGPNIELILLTTPGLGHVKSDAAQMEQVLVNLATNSRDAMPNGGRLVVETSNAELDEADANKLGVKPGSYVMLAVSDTGIGMDPETRARLFEPFFTTKEPGKGSGLGLATVYGVIKQSEGQVTVYSEPGCGTILEIYLPRVKETVTEAEVTRPARGSETILLVDDEEGVRKLVFDILKSNGYEVLEASNSAAALAAYEKNAHKIDMVLTDVVMPQVSGLELGKQLNVRDPALKILYMSGYRDNIMGTEPVRPFLQKPFTPDVLLAKIREVFDAESV